MKSTLVINRAKCIVIIFFLSMTVMDSIAQCSQQEIDFLIENNEEISAASQDCAFDCLFASDQDQCVIDCLEDQFDLSEGCLQCNASQVSCVLDNCVFPCIFPNSPGCLNCIEDNCMPDYFVCIGDADMDGYSVEGGDCNNFDESINPDAIEIPGDGIDQNCDGLDEEVSTGISEWEEYGLRVFPDRVTWESGVVLIQTYSITGQLLDSYDVGGSEFLQLNTYTGIRIFQITLDNGESLIIR
jgi:hypothetical protein